MRIGLCLSGGAAHGFAHLGVLKAFDELNISISAISGTSSGAIAGAFYAAGYSPDAAFDLISKRNILKLMRPAFCRYGLINMDQVEKAFSEYFGTKTLQELKPKLIIGTTDLNQGINVYFREGDIIKPLTASCAVPIVCKPINYPGHFLIDGGLINNLPVECLTGEADFIVGVHVNPFDHQSQITSFRGVMERTFHLAINNNVEPRLKLCNFLIEPPVLKHYSLLSLKDAKKMFLAGYEHTLTLSDKLFAAMQA
ncbi:patatin-like phospholipase family protein [Adhaeribacter aquaticus]|uniref:patatin-like phospholipase family protein n=1 Tax=Adhaeribacter aquaticus TaxID=299567 RepID=UPI00040750B5|nr:patatin-like phospholipase family protein [Adhaeribacter aquaticus]